MVRAAITQGGMMGGRVRAARVCLVAIAQALLVVPGLHALVHHREAEEERGAEPAHEAGQGHVHPAELEHGHEQAGEQDPPHQHPHRLYTEHTKHYAEHHQHHAHRHRHHHHHHRHPRGGPDDESPLEHGDGAPEHLGLALLESDPPQLPLPGQLIDSLTPPAPVGTIRAAARTRAHGSRAPPKDTASQQLI